MSLSPFTHYQPRPCGDHSDHHPMSDDDTEVTCPACRDMNGFTLRTLTDGSQIYPEHRNTITEGSAKGQQQDYVVLSESERARGFVRPVRRSYVHKKCGVRTTMGQALAETYARQPDFYSGTFCCGCGAHFPVGEDGEFVWDGTNEKVGT